MLSEVQSLPGPISAGIEHVFGEFNRRLFSGDVQVPVFGLSPSGRFIFRFIPKRYSLAIGSQFASASQDDRASSMLHEMVHMGNLLGGIVDQTSNQYHNRDYATAAQGIGFYVGKHPTKGWCLTSLTPSPGEVLSPDQGDNEYLERTMSQGWSNPDWCDGIRKLLGDQGPTKQFQLKYVCKCDPPYNSIRSGRRPDGRHPLLASCGHCGQGFVLEETQEDA